MRFPHFVGSRSAVRALVLVAVPVLAFSTACDDDDDPPTGPQTGSFDWTGAVAPGDQLEIRGVNGSVVATRAAGGTAAVTAQLRGNGDDVSAVDVQVVEHEGGVLVCAIYPDVGGEPPNQCDPNDPEVHGDLQVSVDFTVEVPSGADFAAVILNGDLTATGMTQLATLVTVNGSIEVGTTSSLAAITVNGSIDATLDGAELPGPWALTTVNGSIAARLPATVDADVSAALVNGVMSSDYPLTETSPGEWHGTLGSGGTAVALTTVNGNLDLVQIP